jgi:hypothetical protein
LRGFTVDSPLLALRPEPSLGPFRPRRPWRACIHNTQTFSRHAKTDAKSYKRSTQSSNLTATVQLSLSLSHSLFLLRSLSISPPASENKGDQGTHVACQHERHAYKRRRFSPWGPKPPFVPSTPAGPGDPAPPPGAYPNARTNRQHTRQGHSTPGAGIA